MVKSKTNEMNERNEIIFTSDGFIKEKGDWYGIVFRESEKLKVKSQNLKIWDSGFGNRDSGYGDWGTRESGLRNQDETVKRFMVKSKINEINEMNEMNEINTITPSHDLFNPPLIPPFSKGEDVRETSPCVPLLKKGENVKAFLHQGGTIPLNPPSPRGKM